MTRSINPRRNRRFAIALAAVAMGSFVVGLPPLLVSPAEAMTTCIKMPCGGSGGAAKRMPDSTDGFPAEAPDFSGSFRIAYTPIMCVKAPCPPGSYSIYASDRSQFSARVRRVVLRAGHGVEAETFEGRYIGGRGLAVEGDVWIEDRIAYVSMRRALDDD